MGTGLHLLGSLPYNSIWSPFSSLFPPHQLLWRRWPVCGELFSAITAWSRWDREFWRSTEAQKSCGFCESLGLHKQVALCCCCCCLNVRRSNFNTLTFITTWYTYIIKNKNPGWSLCSLLTSKGECLKEKKLS